MIRELVIVLCFVIALLFLFYKYVFSRDPERNIPEKGIVAPADGKVVAVLKTGNISEIGIRKGIISRINALVADVAESCYVVVIMMDVFNVHVQRSPVKGTVKNIRYSRGKFANAVSKASSLRAFENEKNEITIENPEIRIKVIQIAGMVARRIRCYVKENQKLIKGQRIGKIDLGSQVVLIMPKKVNVLIKKNQKVKAGSTIIAELK